MYEVSVEERFPATHAIVMQGQREAPHEHDWRVRVVVGGASLDGDGLLCDFVALQRELERILGRFRGRDLNRTPPFDRVNPTAEHLARHVADSLGALPGGVRLRCVNVTEAPGCMATYVAE